MYVYIKNNSLFRTSDDILQIDCDFFLKTDYKQQDIIIFEDWIIKRYKDSKQYIEDNEIITLEKKVENLENTNSNLQKTNDRILTDFERLKLQDQLLKDSYKKTPWWEPTQWHDLK